MSAATPGEGARRAWVDGSLVDPASPAVPILDRGARGGEGIFETFRVERGRPCFWERHLERLVVSAAELGFPVAPDPRLLARGLGEVLAANDLAERAAVARITMTRGVPRKRPTRAGVWIEAEPLENRLWPGARTQSVRLVVSRRPFQAGFLGRYKTIGRLAYEMCREEARVAGADEVLLVDPEGRVLEGSASNVFVVIEGRLVTPPLSLPILPGIARAVAIERARAMGIPVAEAILLREHLDRAEEIFVTNAVQEVAPAGRLGARILEERSIGSRLAASYRQAAAGEPALG